MTFFGFRGGVHPPENKIQTEHLPIEKLESPDEIFVPLIEIAKILYKYKNSVLRYNPRCFLGLKNNQVNPDIVVAGPAFNAGRYGMACAGVAKFVTETYNAPVTAFNSQSRVPDSEL